MDQVTVKERLEQLCREESDTFWKEKYQQRKDEWNPKPRSHYLDMLNNLLASLVIDLPYARTTTCNDDEAREIVADVEKVIAALTEYDALLEQHPEYRQKETQTREGAFPQLKANTLVRADYVAESKKLLEAKNETSR